MSTSPPPLRILIVDDEAAARELLREMLLDDKMKPQTEIIGECADGQSAIRLIQELRPDLVLLDVQMPELDGFGVLAALPPDATPHVIFTTAYDSYAVNAFEVHALDYLLKPFDEERLGEALRRVRREIGRNDQDQIAERVVSLLEMRSAQPKYAERLVVKDGSRVFFLRADEIEWIGAEGNYVSLHVGKRAHLLRRSITEIEAELDPRRFRRIHRSTIVNIDRILELRPLFRGEYEVILRDGTILKLSHNYRDALQHQRSGLF